MTEKDIQDDADVAAMTLVGWFKSRPRSRRAGHPARPGRPVSATRGLAAGLCADVGRLLRGDHRMSWAQRADHVLEELFRETAPAMPTNKQIREAYPFGERQYHPYKVWLRRVAAWKAARLAGQSRPVRTRSDYQKPMRPPDPQQLEL